MCNPEFEVLYQIGLGLSNLQVIASNCSSEKENVISIISSLKQRRLLKTIDPPQLSSRGLFELSEWLAKLQSGTYEHLYWSHDNLPFFPYRNNLRKDTFFYPNLLFKPSVKAYSEEDMSVVYVVQLLEVDFSIRNLRILTNLLLEHDVFVPIGFWLLKYSRKKVCGWNVDNLKKTIRLLGNPVSMTFLCGFDNYFIFMNSRNDQGSCSKLEIKMYISRESFAYIDSLDYVREKLKPFLVFHNIHSFSEGHEISLKESKWWKELPELGLRIVPNAQGIIYYKDNKYEFDPIPLVVVLTPSEVKTRLAAISPWFVTCPGGCDERQISAHELYRTHSFKVLSLPEMDIVTFMINSVK